MAKASEIFTNAYLKKMRRPELGGGYDPDEAFGANLVHRSESVNPNPIRNQSNAQYGNMKLPTQGGSSLNMGGASSINPGVYGSGMDLAKVIAPGLGSDWASKKILEMFRGKPSAEFLETMIEKPQSMMDVLKTPMFETESGLGGYEKAGQAFVDKVPMPSEALDTTTGVGSSILDTASSVGPGVAASAAGPMMKALTGSNLAGDITSTAATTGLAASQAFLNPISDLAALMGWFKLGSRFF